MTFHETSAVVFIYRRFAGRNLSHIKHIRSEYLNIRAFPPSPHRTTCQSTGRNHDKAAMVPTELPIGNFSHRSEALCLRQPDHQYHAA